MHEFEDLRVLVQAHSPLIVIESFEEPRALILIKRLAVNLMRPVFKWTITDGLQRLDSEQGAQAFNADPTNLLAQIRATQQAEACYEAGNNAALAVAGNALLALAQSVAAILQLEQWHSTATTLAQAVALDGSVFARQQYQQLLLAVSAYLYHNR